MSPNSSDKPLAPAPPKEPKRRYLWRWAIALPLWVLAGFVVSQLLLSGVMIGLNEIGVPVKSINSSVFNTILAACVYILTLLLVIGVPLWLKKRRTTREDIGLTRLPSWLDIGLAPVGFVIYFLISAILIYTASRLIPGFDVDEAQDIGFENLVRHFEYILAFITLVVLAPLAEEILFRGYLYGKLKKAVPLWLAILVTSLLFAFVHGRWNVAIDVFALSIVLCSLREVTGSIWAGIILHMVKNGLAFYLLFINPSLLNI